MKADSQLKTEVLNELRSEPSLHVDDIAVNTHNGTVTLTVRAIPKFPRVAIPLEESRIRWQR